MLPGRRASNGPVSSSCPRRPRRNNLDRQTIWNAVEEAERGKDARLAYSFDIALQNEFSLEENIALARQFLSEHFVSRGLWWTSPYTSPTRRRGFPQPPFPCALPHPTHPGGLDEAVPSEIPPGGGRSRHSTGTGIWNGKPEATSHFPAKMLK